MIMLFLPLIQIAAIEPPRINSSFLLGVAWVESGLDPNAKGDFKDGIPQSIGAFQIQEIYVDEVNRILEMKEFRERFGERVVKLTGYPYFSYKDRWNILKSKLITEINLTYLQRYFTRKGYQLTYADLMNIHCWQYSWTPEKNKTEKGRKRIDRYKKFCKEKLDK